MKKSENPGVVIMGKILMLENANEDDTLRQEYRDRNNILIKNLIEKLKEYET